MALKVGELYADLSLDTSNFDKTLAAAAGKMAQFGKGMIGAGTQLTKYVTAPIVGIGVAAIKMSTDFNAAMANVATLIPGNVARIDELKRGVQDMAVSTGKGTADLTDGLYNVISAFGDTSDTLKILDMNARAGADGMATTLDAINLTSAVTKGYGDTSAEAVGKASDLALMTVRLGQTTFPELAASIGKVTPLAKGLNVSQEELFATFATLTGVTGGAAEVSTQFRGVLSGLMAPTKEMTALINKLGYENGAAALKGEGFHGVVQAIAREAESAGLPLQNFMGSVEGQTAILALAGAQSSDYTSKLQQMGAAAGTTGVAFNEMTSGVNKTGFTMNQFRARLEVTAQKLGDGLAPALNDILTRLSPFIDGLLKAAAAFSEMDGPSQMVVIAIAGIAAAIGPLLVAIGHVMAAMPALAAVFGFIASPIGLLVVAIAGITAAFVMAYKSSEEFRNVVNGAVKKVYDTIKQLMAIIAPIVQEAFAEILDFARDTWPIIADIVGAAMELISELIAIAAEKILAFWEKWGDEIMTVVRVAWAGIRASIEIALAIIRGIIQTATAILRGDWRGAWEAFSGIFKSAWASVRTAVDTALKAVGQYVLKAMTDAASKWRERWDNMITTVKGIPGKITSALGNLGTLLIDAGRKIIQGLIDGIKEKIGDVKKVMSNVTQDIRDFLPFSPAKTGPLSGSGSPDLAGAKIMQMLIDGIKAVNPAPAMAAHMETIKKIIGDSQVDKLLSFSSGKKKAGSADITELMNSLNAELEAVKKSLATREELEEQAYQERIAKLKMFRETGILDELKYNEMIERAEAEHKANMLSIYQQSEAYKAELERVKAEEDLIKQQEADALALEKENADNAAKLERMKQHFMTAEQLENLRYEQQLADLEESLTADFVLSEEYAILREQMEQEHTDKLVQIRKDGMTDLEKFTAMSYGQQAATIFGQLSSITSGVARENARLFAINKAASIANAIMNAYTGISKTMSQYPFPINIGMAAAHAAAAFAQVKSIQQAKMAKGGLVTGPTNALIGEGGSDEAVIPLNQPTLANLGEQIGQFVGGGVNKMVNIIVELDGRTIARAVRQPLADDIYVRGGVR